MSAFGLTDSDSAAVLSEKKTGFWHDARWWCIITGNWATFCVMHGLMTAHRVKNNIDDIESSFLRVERLIAHNDIPEKPAQSIGAQSASLLWAKFHFNKVFNLQLKGFSFNHPAVNFSLALASFLVRQPHKREQARSRAPKAIPSNSNFHK